MLDPKLNVALGKTAVADTELACGDATDTDTHNQDRGYDCNAANAVDGLFGNDHRWVSTPRVFPNDPGSQALDQHWIAIDLQRRYAIHAVEIFAGWDAGGDDPASPDYAPQQGLCAYEVQTIDPQAADSFESLGLPGPARCTSENPCTELPPDQLREVLKPNGAAESAWETQFTHAAHTTSQVHDEFARGTTWARYVRLKIDQSGDCDGIRVNDYARIYEIRVLSAIAVRCCADATRKCYDEGEGGVSAVAGGGSGGGCAADSSLYLCGELGWTTKSTADAHVGGSSEVW